jgi:TRAP-type C4-dicarboxylate transport system permease small subunit
MVARILDVIRVVERGGAVFFFAAMLVLFFVNIAVRILLPSLSSSVAWAEEAARIAMIWALFLIGGLTLERGRHIAMSTVAMQFPEAVQRAIRRATGVVGCLFFGYFSFLAGRLTIFVFESGQILPSLGISSAIIYMGAVLGLALLSLRYLLEIVRPTISPAGIDEA